MINATRHRWCVPGADQACVAVWLALVAWGRPVWAQDTADNARPISYGAEITFGSGHADRGFIISDRPVLQPVTWVTGGGAEFSVWSNFTLTETTGGSRPQILETELTHEGRWKHLTIAPAITMFFYRDLMSTDRDRSIQGWLYLSYDVRPIRLFTNHSLDLLRYRGAYYGEAGIEWQRHVSPGVELGSSFGAGWASSAFNDDYAGVAKSALDRVFAEGWLTAHVNPRWYIGPHVAFSTLVDREVRAGAYVVRPTYVLVRLTTGGEF